MQESIESYISRTLQREEVDVKNAEHAAEDSYQQMLIAMRKELDDALKADDKLKAIRLAHKQLEENEDDEQIESLYYFLLKRVGVPARVEYLAISRQLIVQGVSAIAMLIPLLILGSRAFTTDRELVRADSGIAPFLFASLIFGIPFWDTCIARYHNYINKYRLIK